MFETCGFLIVPNALSEAETAACTAAAERVHANEAFVTSQLAQQGAGEHDYMGTSDDPLLNCWRQLDNVFEVEPAFEPLIDHPSVIEKVRARLRTPIA